MAEQKKELQEKKIEKYYKFYKSGEQLPVDWSLKMGLEITVPLDGTTEDQQLVEERVQKQLDNLSFYIYNTDSGSANANTNQQLLNYDLQSQSK